MNIRKAIHFSIVDNQYYNLISRFISCDPESGIFSASLCAGCEDAINAHKIPTYSIANGVDFGDALAFDLEQLTVPEQYLVALGRVYGTVLKLTGNQDEERQSAFTGHMITFPQPDEILMAEIERISKKTALSTYPRMDDLHQFLSVVFVGARQQWDAFVPTRYSRIPEIQVNPQKVYRYLRMLKALHPAYRHIIIDDSEEMTQKMNNIPSQLLKNTEIIDSDMEKKMEQLLQPKKVIKTDENDDAFFPDLPTVFLTHSAPLPTNLNAPATSVLKSNKDFQILILSKLLLTNTLQLI